MVVVADNDYQLFVDNVAWQPIETTEEGDIYVVASGGRFVFYSGSNQVMTFLNVYTPDFEFQRYQRVVFLNENGNAIPPNVDDLTSYVQTESRANAVAIRSVLFGEYSEEVAALPVSVNQGYATITPETGYLNIQITEYDNTKYLQVMLGNVLTAFITPID